jgi:hypothetical protein
MIRLKSEEKAEEKRKRLKRYGKAEVRGKSEEERKNIDGTKRLQRQRKAK